MKPTVWLVLLVVAATAMAADQEMEDKAKWIEFKAKYKKGFSSPASESARFAIFQQSLRRAERLQALNPEAIFGVTKFSDLTPAEFRARYTGLNISSSALLRNAHNPPSVPSESFTLGTTDWSLNSNRVTPVKMQGSCGSCWTYSTTGVLEGCYGKTHTIKSLSEQNVLDCFPNNRGCSGEDPRAALIWAGGHGLNTETVYPYKMYKQSSCQEVSSSLIGQVSTTIGSAGNTEAAIRTALASSPVAIGVDADPLQDYSSGVITSCTERTINHAVLLVGDILYYKVKNSWDSDWGEDGYFRMRIGSDCLGITIYATKAC